uniref:Uncharacterized protein n=1 Tax=Setaria italica TaxID=4555 RepID=K3Y3Y9_SETIT
MKQVMFCFSLALCPLWSGFGCSAIVLQNQNANVAV